MKALKYIGLSILALLVLLLGIIPLFLPSKVHVERSIDVNAAPEVVFEQVNNFKNWLKWSPWEKKDPAMKKTFSGPDAGVGATYTWESQNPQVGNGKMVITESKPNESVVTELDFMENGKALGGYTFVKTDNGTKATWYFDVDMGMNPFGKWAGVFMDKMLAPDFEAGLNNLKQASESAQTTPTSSEVTPAATDSSATQETK